MKRERIRFHIKTHKSGSQKAALFSCYARIIISFLCAHPPFLKLTCSLPHPRTPASHTRTHTHILTDTHPHPHTLTHTLTSASTHASSFSRGSDGWTEARSVAGAEFFTLQFSFLGNDGDDDDDDGDDDDDRYCGARCGAAVLEVAHCSAPQTKNKEIINTRTHTCEIMSAALNIPNLKNSPNRGGQREKLAKLKNKDLHRKLKKMQRTRKKKDSTQIFSRCAFALL